MTVISTLYDARGHIFKDLTAEGNNIFLPPFSIHEHNISDIIEFKREQNIIFLKIQ